MTLLKMEGDAPLSPKITQWRRRSVALQDGSAGASPNRTICPRNVTARASLPASRAQLAFPWHVIDKAIRSSGRPHFDRTQDFCRPSC